MLAQLQSTLAALQAQMSSVSQAVSYWQSQVAIAAQNAQTYAQTIANLQAQIAARQSVGGTGTIR